jgi:uncharacterized lipoprotein YddW (UPF0748 family)
MHKVVYGLTSDLAQYAGCSPVDIGKQLRDDGNDGVFLKNPTQEWITALQQAGLKVYASQPVFLASAALWRQYPGSRPLTASAAPAAVEGWYHPALPTSASFRALRLQQFTQLVTTLPLDGVWLDFIRWPARWERPSPQLYHSSFDPGTLQQFQQDTHITLPVTVQETQQAAQWILNHAAPAWFAWRCRQITAIVAEARKILSRNNPSALLGIFTVPWIPHHTPDDIKNAQVQIVGQDVDHLSKIADIISPMVYHRLTGHRLTWVKEVVDWHMQAANCG